VKYKVVSHMDSSVGVVTSYGLDDRMIGIRFPVRTGNFSLRHRIQTGSGPPPKPPIQWIPGGSFPVGKAAEAGF
jgi:hypothetical protein